jgi:hypothetical protein
MHATTHTDMCTTHAYTNIPKQTPAHTQKHICKHMLDSYTQTNTRRPTHYSMFLFKCKVNLVMYLPNPKQQKKEKICKLNIVDPF